MAQAYIAVLTHIPLTVFLVHWPVPLNPKGNHPTIPVLPDGRRDVDHSWKLTDTWKQMEDVQKKGESLIALDSSIV